MWSFSVSVVWGKLWPHPQVLGFLQWCFINGLFLVGLLVRETESYVIILMMSASHKFDFFKNINLYIQEAWWTLSRMNLKRPTPRWIIIKLSKDKESILKAAREKWLIIYKKSSLKSTANFLSKTVGAEGSEITYSKWWKKKISINNSVFRKIILKNEEEIKMFLGKENLR